MDIEEEDEVLVILNKINRVDSLLNRITAYKVKLNKKHVEIASLERKVEAQNNIISNMKEANLKNR